MNSENTQVSKAERLSALVDNETDAFETRRLVDELVKSEADRAQWARYHLIGDSLRGGMSRLAPPDFLAGVKRGIDGEAPLSMSGQPVSAVGWLKPVAGVGVAAAVAMVTLLGFQMLATDGPGPAPAPATAHVAPAQEADETELAVTPDPRFARYLENHAELVTPGSSAFARVRNSIDGE